ncbi:hypothetical protein ACFSQQ_39785 [Mesorhizobium kowhaii]|uniref:hypothetical protein n=1 Tax=Mesorhizobium kowhaii TaxID=1300272 RepID=UPI0035EC170F
MATNPDNTSEGLFIIDLSKLGLSHEELIEIETDINAAVMARLKANPKGAKRSFMRPPGPPMGLWIQEK